MRTNRVALIVLVGAIVLGAVAVLLVPSIKVRLHFVAMKLGGQLGELSWEEVRLMATPGNRYPLADLVADGNPYEVIHNVHGSAQDAQVGASVFRSSCSGCHGPDAGGGAIGPALDRPTLSHGDSDWAIHRNIRRGIPGTRMEGQQLSDTEIWQVVAYLRTRQQQSRGLPPDDSAPPQPSVPSVSPERLANARGEPQSWLTYSGAYDGWRHSTLGQIDRGNVARLQLKWMRQTEAGNGLFEATPVVNGDTMYVSEPPDQVHALEAATGRLLWTWQRAVPEKLPLCCGRVNRGVAVYGDRVFVGTLDAHLVALDARTGRELWNVEVDDYHLGSSITGAPLAVKGLVVVGTSGGEYGARGVIDAYDAATGRRVWRFDAIPGPGDQGHDTWPGDAWKTGGGGTWLTGSYDPQRNLLYWGVGNPSPNYYGDSREGDNLFTASVVALDLATGKRRWHYQFTPHDVRDWDSNQIPVLVDAAWQGRQRPLMLFANRNGFFYVLDRETGELLLAQPFVKQNWASGIGKDGRPVIIPETLPSTQGVISWPSIFGGTNWQSPSYDPGTGLLSVPFVEGGRIIFKQADRPRHEPGKPFWGGQHQTISRDSTFFTGIRAIDPATGKVRWEHRNAPRKNWWWSGGVLSTAGGILFSGDDEDLYAVDASSGRQLWRLAVGGRVNASPITYLAGGEQRITVAAGRMLLTFGLPAATGSAPEAGR